MSLTIFGMDTGRRLDEAAMEKADGGPAELEVFVTEEAVALPLQKSVQDHRREQLP